MKMSTQISDKFTEGKLLDGIWLAIVAAELVALGIAVWYLARYAGKYNYSW